MAVAAVPALLAAAAFGQGSILDQGRSLLDSINKPAPTTPGRSSNLSTAEIGSGLREALRVGTERVVQHIGRPDGFNANPEIHIPLPDTLHRVQSALKAVGASGMADDLELRFNRAAEAATPKAKELFWKAINEMTWDDVQHIYRGPKDAATQYLKAKMSNPLADAMRPIVDRSLADAGAIHAYDQMMGRYRSLPLVPDAKADLTTHVLEKAMGAIFLYLGREEAAIRENPAQRTTDLLKKVFGAAG
ncbi:MAG: DUF4197 domain-containing protein [Proteobacteria bacterium]|nr:DUF4197 domain-containing protein [Pseudomonadota bacterium]